MLCLSKTTGYAVRALGCLHQHGCRDQLSRNIARCACVPKPYFAQIINKLNHQGLVVARRGLHGGIALARPPQEITLLQIVEAVEGPDWIGPCLLNIEECAAPRYCPTREVWQRVSRQIKAVLSKTTLADVMVLPGHRKATRRRKTAAIDSIQFSALQPNPRPSLQRRAA